MLPASLCVVFVGWRRIGLRPDKNANPPKRPQIRRAVDVRRVKQSVSNQRLLAVAPCAPAAGQFRAIMLDCHVTANTDGTVQRSIGGLGA